MAPTFQAEPGETLFFGCANSNYYDFIPLHAASVLSNVPNTTVEIVVDDQDAFKVDHARATDMIHQAFGRERLLVRPVDWTVYCPGRKVRKRIVPGSVRFVTMPVTRADYVHIGDVDIIVLDPEIVRRHLNFMAQTGLPYSNKVRKRPQLRGLHFTRYDAYYPLPDLSHIDLSREGDEALLYQIVQLRGLPIQDKDGRPPMPGIHVSPNRPPEGRLLANGQRGAGWGIEKWTREFIAFSETALMQELRPALSSRIQSILETISSNCESLLLRSAFPGIKPDLDVDPAMSGLA